MRRARALQTTAQDVCIFCAFRATSITRVSYRQYLSSAASSRRQQTGPAFREETDEGGFGGLAEEVEATVPKPPPIPERRPEPLHHDPPIRFPRTGRGAPLRIRKHGSDYNTPNERGSDARVINLRSVPSHNHTPEAQIDSDRAARWLIRDRQSPRQGSWSSSGSHPAPAAAQQSTTSASQDRQPTHRRSGPFISQNRSWPHPLPGNNSYIAFDTRFNGADFGRKAEQVRQAPRDEQTSKDLGSSTFKSNNTVGWQPTVPLEPEPTHQQTHKLDVTPQDVDCSMTKHSYDAPRVTRRAYGRGFSPPRAQQQFDEYGLPIDSSTSRSVGSGGSQGRDTASLSSQSEIRSRKGKERKVFKDRRDEEDETPRRKEQKKERASRRQEEEDNDDFDYDEYHRSKRERQAQRSVAKDVLKTREERRTIRLPDFIRVGSLATELGLRYGRFANILQKFGFDDVNSDFVLSAENAALIVEEAGFTAVTESEKPDEDLYAAPLPKDMSAFPQRPPVVTIMGHVDHGKTTILDYMRKSSIVASEHGGITQHIGAFSVPMPSGKTITFLDTPGHAAFLSMRQRGANVTDIVILVVAADDSVMPQTLEALRHAKAANVPIIVAMNKIDKPEAKPDQVKQDLARHGVEIEDFGGDVQVVKVSGKTGQGMPDLEEAIVALSEIQDQRAPNDGAVEGWVLESSTKEVGKVATVLIRRGTLRPGDIIVAGTEYCRVRSMRDEFGNQIAQVSPGMPAEIDGWRGQPNAGDEVLQAPNEQVAGDVTDLREAKLKRAEMGKDVEAINEMRKAHQQKHEREKAIERARKEGIKLPEITTETEDGPGIKNVYFIVKGDVAGSVEAVINAIATLGNSEVQPVILKSAVGAVSESDIDHATAAGGQVISFNTSISPTMRALAERAGTKILDHNIIYRLVDDVRTSLEDVLPPIIKSRVLGEAEIAQIFEINMKRKKHKIAGCKVRNGTILRNRKVKIVRGFNNEVVYTGSFTSLKNVKKDVMEMGKGTECGMSFEDFENFEVGDIAQCYEEWEERRKL